MNADAVRFQDVRKRFGRSQDWALAGFSCRVPKGAICGLVGPNGAGKSTAIELASGFLTPTSGHIEVLGTSPADRWGLKGRLGVLPQDTELGNRHTAMEILVHLAWLQGLPRSVARVEALRMLDLVALGAHGQRPIGRLSHGMRRRVAIASALLGTPELVLLDEPTAGLDPSQVRALRRLLVEAQNHQTVVISSHDLPELERTCDWVVMVEAGRCVVQGTVAEVTAQAQVVRWSLGGGQIPLHALRRALPGHDLELREGDLLHIAPPGACLDESSVRVMQILAEAGVAVRELRRGASLEDRFLEGENAVGGRSP